MKDRVVVGGLVALFLLSAACGGGSASSSTGCQTDIDCKGTRLCQAAACIDAPSSTGSTGGTGGTGSTDSTGGAGGTGGAGTSPSSSSGAAAAYCTHPDPGSCACQVNQGGPNQASCGPSLLGGPSMCCAADTWPQPGSTCGCGVYECYTGHQDCSCGTNSAGTSSSVTCGGQSCCASPGNHGDPNEFACTCFDVAGGVCGGQTVPSCSLTDVAGVCGSGYHAVTECR